MLGRFFGAADNTNAKLAFRQSLQRLYQETIDAADIQYWDAFLTIFSSSAEVYSSLLPVELIRTAILHKSQNIDNLISHLTSRIFRLLNDSAVFPPAAASSWSLSSSSSSDTTREMLNALRLLTRILPIVFEVTASLNTAEDRYGETDWAEKLFWAQKPAASTYADQQQFVIDDDDEEAADNSLLSNVSAHSTHQIPLQPSLGHKLLMAAVDLLFVVGFTLPPQLEPSKRKRKIQYTIWQPGIGSSVQLRNTTKQHLSNRAEVLRFFIALLSSSMYLKTNQFLNHLVTLREKKPALTLLCSLLNTCMLKTEHSSLLTSSYEAINKIQVVTTGQREIEEQASLLPKFCFSLLNILLISHDVSPNAGLQDSINATNGLLSPTRERDELSLAQSSPKTDNIFRFYAAKIHQNNDFLFLVEGFANVLHLAHNGTTSLLPLHVPVNIPGVTGSDSVTLEKTVTDVIILLWRLSENNKSFASYLVDSDKCPELVVLLLNFSLDCKEDAASAGLIRLCAFTLQSLSAQRGFGQKLNTSLASVPAAKKHTMLGSHKVIDFLITSVYTLVVSTQGLNTIYSSFILIISNCSPYVKGLSVVASTKLMQLFLAFSAPSFILAEEGNPRLVYYLVETFNNILHHQLSDNPHLIYALIRSHSRFEYLANFTLKTAVEDIRRMKAERRANSAGTTPTTDQESRPELKPTLSSLSLLSIAEEKSTDEADPVRMSEKARGKMRERQASFDEGESADPGPGFPYRSRSGFTPTEGWVSSWREHMPLDSILVLLAELRPKVSSLCSVASPRTDQAVVDFLKSVTLIDVLPPVPPLKARTFQHSAFSSKWLCSIAWSSIYRSNLPVFLGTHIKLFQIQQAAQRDVYTEATEAIGRVGHAVMQRIPSGTNTPRRSFSAIV